MFSAIAEVLRTPTPNLYSHHGLRDWSRNQESFQECRYEQEWHADVPQKTCSLFDSPRHMPTTFLTLVISGHGNQWESHRAGLQRWTRQAMQCLAGILREKNACCSFDCFFVVAAKGPFSHHLYSARGVCEQSASGPCMYVPTTHIASMHSARCSTNSLGCWATLTCSRKFSTLFFFKSLCVLCILTATRNRAVAFGRRRFSRSGND